jgi:hypothetical protein
VAEGWGVEEGIAEGAGSSGVGLEVACKAGVSAWQARSSKIRGMNKRRMKFIIALEEEAGINLKQAFIYPQPDPAGTIRAQPNADIWPNEDICQMSTFVKEEHRSNRTQGITLL